MASVHSRASRASIVVIGGLLACCGLLDIGPANQITRIEPASIQIEVVEFGPLDPERLAFPSTSPVAEVLPGDRVQLGIEVVDVDGLALAADRLDSVWFVLDTDLRDPALDLACDELDDWTLSSRCRLADSEGGASVVFEVPPLGDEFVQYMVIYAVLAWDGRRPSDCWAGRLAKTASLERCDFVRFSVAIGPPWFLLSYAASLGLSRSTYDADLFPTSVFTQQANRAPQATQITFSHANGGSEVWPVVDGVVGPVSVESGQRLTLDVELDEGLQTSQARFTALNQAGDLFTIQPEQVWLRVSTSGPILVDQQQAHSLQQAIVVEVDDDAAPGIARLLIAVYDTRGGEQLVRVELDVQ